MNWKKLPIDARLRFAALAMLGLGLAVGCLIYVTAPHRDDPGANYQIIDGQIYIMSPDESKAYDAQLERFGGKSAVYADKINRWLGGLWRGPELGLTVASLATLTAAMLFMAAGIIERDRAERKLPQRP